MFVAGRLSQELSIAVYLVANVSAGCTRNLGGRFMLGSVDKSSFKIYEFFLLLKYVEVHENFNTHTHMNMEHVGKTATKL